jgi:iron complex transport system substrate-binding protein
MIDDRCLRILSLLPGATETLVHLGVGAQLVAVSHECDFPPEVTGLPKATRSRIDPQASSAEIDRLTRELWMRGEPLFELDYELLIQLRPNLIVAQSQCRVCAISADQILGWLGRQSSEPARLVVLDAQRFEDVLGGIRQLGEATARHEEAQRLIGALQERIARLRAALVASGAEPLRVVCLEWLDPPILAGNWTPELVAMAGGICPAIGPGESSRRTSWDEVADCNPDVIVLMPCGFPLKRVLDEARELAMGSCARLSVWQHGRVYAVDGNAYFNRMGPRLVDSAEILAHLFHPQIGQLGVPRHEGTWCSVMLDTSGRIVPGMRA